jgi:3-oxoadipate enol-lactonase
MRTGVKIWYEVMGSGSPIVLIQGLGYTSGACWRVISELAELHTVILVDNRGVGRSEVPPGSWTIAEMAADVAAVLDEIGVVEANVAGFSLGGLVAQELALSRPELVSTLILGCTSSGGRAAIPFTSDVADQFTDWGTLAPEDAAWRAAAVCYSEDTSLEKIQEDIRVRMVHPINRHGYIQQLRAVGQYQGAGDRLAATWHRPVLIVHGDADQIVPPDNVDVLRSFVPHAEVVLVPRAGHILMTDARRELIEAMLGFVYRHAPEGEGSPRPRVSAT